MREILGGAPETRDHVFAHRGIERAERAYQLRFVGNDVEAHAALELAGGQHHRRGRDVHLARDDRLRTQQDLRADGDRIDAIPRPRPMRLLAAHGERPLVRARHQRAAARADLAHRQPCPDVQTEHRLRLEFRKNALLQHQRRAEILPGFGRAFLGGLEHEHHLARQFVPHRRQRRRHAQQHRHMRIVTAGMHHPDRLAAIGAHDLRCERQPGLLGHRQCIHVGADRDARPGPASLEDRGHAGGRDAGARLQTQGPQLIGDEFRGADLMRAEFRMLMQVATPFDHLRLEVLQRARCRGVLRMCAGRAPQQQGDREKHIHSANGGHADGSWWTEPNGSVRASTQEPCSIDGRTKAGRCRMQGHRLMETAAEPWKRGSAAPATRCVVASRKRRPLQDPRKLDSDSQAEKPPGRKPSTPRRDIEKTLSRTSPTSLRAEDAPPYPQETRRYDWATTEPASALRGRGIPSPPRNSRHDGMAWRSHPP